MHTFTPIRLHLPNSVTYQGIVEDAQIEMMKESTLNLVRKRFGTIPESFQQQVQGLTELVVLRELLLEVGTAESLDEVTALLD